MNQLLLDTVCLATTGLVRVALDPAVKPRDDEGV